MENKGFEADSKGEEVTSVPTLRTTNVLADQNVVPQEDQTVHMKRQIGLLGGVALIVGTIIGSGIFISSQRLLTRTDSVAGSLVVWTCCGIIATLSALSYGELGTVIPKSGGEHAYLLDTFGRSFFGQLPSFIFSWLTVFLLKPSSLAILSLSFGRYTLYPILFTSSYEGCDFQESQEYQTSMRLLAVAVAILISGLNIFSAKLATRMAVVFLGAKLSAMALMIGIGVYNIARGDFGALDLNGTAWDKGNATVGQIAASFYSGLWAYDGWNNLNFAMEELINPYRNLPLAIIIGMALVICLYVGINVAYLTALSKAEMMASQAVAIDVGNKYLGVMKWIVPVMVTLSVAGTANGSVFTAGRISYVAGREGHMADVMSYVHVQRLTPIIAILLNMVLGIALIFASEVNNLIDLFGFASWAFYGLSLSCVVILRFTHPDIPRPFKVPIIIPILAALSAAVLVVLPFIDDPTVEYLYCLAFALLGVIVYWIFVWKQYRLPFMDGFTKYIQLLSLAAPSPYKQD